MAGLGEVPVLVREVPDNAALAMALIENIQREDLNPLEEAAGLQRLIDEFNMTHEQAADAVGRSRSATTNLLRLLKLAKPVQAMLMQGTLEMGHARALLALDGARQVEAANRIAARGLSVRETEALAARLQRGPAARRKQRTDRDLARLEEEVSAAAGNHGADPPGPQRQRNDSHQLLGPRSSRPIAEEAALTVDDRILRRNTLTHSAPNQYNSGALQHAGARMSAPRQSEQADSYRPSVADCRHRSSDADRRASGRCARRGFRGFGRRGQHLRRLGVGDGWRRRARRTPQGGFW